MNLRVSNCRLEWVDEPRDVTDPGERFEAVREHFVALHGPAKPLRRALAGATVECRHEPLAARDCPRCEHFLSAIPSADGSQLRVRCLFLELDTVDALMTGSDRLLTIDESSSLEAARALARKAGVRQLVVTSGEEVVGLLPIQGSTGTGTSPVRRKMLPIPVLPVTASLATVARIMREHSTRCLVVVDREHVVGLVTRGDLCRAGVPESVLAGWATP